MNNVAGTKNQLDWPAFGNCNHAVHHIIFGVRIHLVQANIVKRGIVDKVWISAAKDSVLAGVMEVPLKLLRDHLNLKRPCRSFVKVQRRPDALAHNRKPDKDDCRYNRPDNLETIAAVRIDRSIALAAVSIFPNHVAQTDLGSSKCNSYNNDCQQKLTIKGGRVSRDGFRKPPLLYEEKAH